LLLDKIENINEIDRFSYYLVPIGRNYLEKHKEVDYSNLEDSNSINVKLRLRNIGYGVATNIKFYNLLTAKQVHGTQSSSKDQNQQLFTTFDIAADEEKSVQAILINHLKEDESILITTDGLHNLLDGKKLIKLLNEPLTTQEKVDSLVNKALDLGGNDNITLILLEK
jgi:serine/threonine protein phosphatase PrpC